MPEALPESLRQKHNLCTYSEAILQAHAPESREKLAAAKRYLAFEQLIIYQLRARLHAHARRGRRSDRRG